MAVDVRRVPVPAPVPHIPIHARLYGLGSVFGKTLRDSRTGIIVIGGFVALLVMVAGISMTQAYGTPEARQELATMSATLPPIMRGMYGDPIGVDTMGGFISWHYGPYIALLVGLWSILVLSSTLAAEAQRGSLDFAVATPRSRRSVALQKAGAHVTAVAIAMAFVACFAWATGALVATLPGDSIAPEAAIGFAVGLGIRALVAGSLAFALAPFLGRVPAAGLAGVAMLGGYILHSYRAVVPWFDTLSHAGWFSWTAGHVPLAGQSDWAGIALTAVVSVVLLAIGVEAFARRDVGVTIAVPWPRLPRPLLGVNGPLGRSFGDLLPRSFAWGLGLGLYGILMATASLSLLDALNSAPAMAEAFRNMIPDIDITTAEGFLQLAFVDIGLVLIGLAVTSLIAIRSSDETSGRLELLLATPLTRARWVFASGVAVMLATALITVLLAVAVAVGVISIGQDPVTPAAGMIVLAVYGFAIAGIGVAVAGVFGATLAVPVVLVIAVGTFLLDVFAPILRMPDWVAQLALTTHLGQPMVGEWDAIGMAVCLVLAVGGLVIGAWGMGRRDLGR